MLKTCLNCGVDIPKVSKQWSIQKFCSSRCRKYYHRKKTSTLSRVERRRSNLRQNEQIVYLINQCKKAGTVQILEGHTLQSFIETMRLVENRPGGDVRLCHIAPVKGEGLTGLFHTKNLFYGGKFQNERFGNKYMSGGLFVWNENLDSKWLVSKQTSNNEVLLKVESFLEVIMAFYLEEISVRKSKKLNIANKISMLDSSSNIDDLILTSYSSLVKRWASLTKIRTYMASTPRESKYKAYMDSLKRFWNDPHGRGKLMRKVINLMVIGYMALNRINESNTYNKYFYVDYGYLIQSKYLHATLKNPELWPEFKDLIYDFAFMALQGAAVDIDSFRKVVMNYLHFPQSSGF